MDFLKDLSLPCLVKKMRHNAFSVLLIAFCACVLVLSGCGKFFSALPVNPGCTTNCGSAGDFLYIANSEVSTPKVAPGIGGFSLASSALTAIPGSPFTLSGLVPTALAVNPANDTYLYVADVQGGIYLYAIDSDTGALVIQNNGAAVVPSIQAQAMQVDATGGWLLVISTAVSSPVPTITAFPLDATTGLLTTATAQALSLNGGVGTPAGLVIAPNNTVAFVSLGTAGVEIVNFTAATGALADGGNLQTYGSGHGSSQNFDGALAVNPASTFLFIAESGFDGVRVATITPTTGALHETTGSPYLTGVGPSAVLVDSTGQYVYVTNRTDGTVSGFSFTGSGAAAGTLTKNTGSPFVTGTTPVGIVEDKSNTYIAVLCQGGSPDLQLFTLDATVPGKLDSFATTATGTDPTVPVAIAGTH